MRNNSSKLSELLKKLKEGEKLLRTLEEGNLKDLSDKDIFHPNGYGSKLAESLGIPSVQLRRIYQEFKNLCDLAEKGRIDEATPRLYKLYAIVEYQAGRGIINEKFKELVHEILNNIEKHIGKDENTAKENLKRAYDLMMAIVAYSKKGG